MKWIRTLILFDKGDIASSTDWGSVHESYVRSISSIDHPRGTGQLTLRRKVKLPNGEWKRNGVSYLRSSFLDNMQQIEKWHSEGNVDLGRDRRQPPIRLFPSNKAYTEPITGLSHNIRASSAMDKDD